MVYPNRIICHMMIEFTRAIEAASWSKKIKLASIEYIYGFSTANGDSMYAFRFYDVHSWMNIQQKQKAAWFCFIHLDPSRLCAVPCGKIQIIRSYIIRYTRIMCIHGDAISVRATNRQWCTMICQIWSIRWCEIRQHTREHLCSCNFTISITLAHVETDTSMMIGDHRMSVANWTRYEYSFRHTFSCISFCSDFFKQNSATWHLKSSGKRWYLGTYLLPRPWYGQRNCRNNTIENFMGGLRISWRMAQGVQVTYVPIVFYLSAFAYFVIFDIIYTCYYCILYILYINDKW